MDKRDLIINAALKLFVDNGFHGTATSKIAKEAGVANGTLFQYFKTKDELVMALYINIKDELKAYILKNTVQNTHIREELKSQILSSLYWALDNSLKFHFVQQFHSSPYIGQVEQEILNKYVKPHLVLIEKGIEQGIIKQLPVDLIYSLISHQIFGLYQFLISKNLSTEKQQEIIESTFDMLWDMIK